MSAVSGWGTLAIVAVAVVTLAVNRLLRRRSRVVPLMPLPSRTPAAPSQVVTPPEVITDVITAMARDMASGCTWCLPPSPDYVGHPCECKCTVRCSGIAWCAGTSPVRILREGRRG